MINALKKQDSEKYSDDSSEEEQKIYKKIEKPKMKHQYERK